MDHGQNIVSANGQRSRERQCQGSIPILMISLMANAHGNGSWPIQSLGSCHMLMISLMANAHGKRLHAKAHQVAHPLFMAKVHKPQLTIMNHSLVAKSHYHSSLSRHTVKRPTVKGQGSRSMLISNARAQCSWLKAHGEDNAEAQQQCTPRITDNAQGL